MASQPPAPTEKRRVHRLEPELRQPAPRHTAPTKGVRIVGWVALALVGFAGICFATGQVTFEGEAEGFALAARFSVFGAGIVLLFWVTMQSAYWLSSPLVRNGTATVGVIEAPPKAGLLDALDALGRIARPGQGSKRLNYRYRVGPEEWREASKRVQSWKVGSWGEPGATVTVLYDPARPERHAFYPVLKAHVVVRPATEGSATAPTRSTGA